MGVISRCWNSSLEHPTHMKRVARSYRKEGLKAAMTGGHLLNDYCRYFLVGRYRSIVMVVLTIKKMKVLIIGMKLHYWQKCTKLGSSVEVGNVTSTETLKWYLST